MSRVHLAITLSSLLLAACAHTPPTPDAKEVDTLTIEGTKALDEAEVKKKIVTSESSWLPWWVPLLGHTGWLDESAWQADLRRITRFYEANGYYQARVLDERITDTSPGHVKVDVKVKEGDRALLTSLTITGLDDLPADLRAKVLEDLPVQQGQPFLEDQWETSKSLLGSRLRELGFAEVTLVGEALVHADEATVEATLNITTGTRFHFGEVFVATDARAQIPGKLIKDVALPDLLPTQFYSDSALQLAQNHVQQMGVFGGVKVNRGAPDHGDNTVPVIVDVREAPFRSVRAGFGLTGDLIRQEVRVIGEYTNRNLGFARLFSNDTYLDRLTVKGKVGWAFLPTIFAVAANDPGAKNGPTFKLTTEYEIPRVFGTRTVSFQSALDLSRALDAAFDYYGGELKLGFIWRPRFDLTFYPSLNFDTYIVNTQVSVRDNVPAATIGCPLGAPCIISFLELTAEFDRRDNKLEPKEGYYFALSTQGGVAQTSQFRPYFRVVPEARGYVSFGGKEKKFTIAGKLRAGTLISTDNETPIVARFFSGGSNMRGFNQRRLSPLVAVPTATVDYPKGDPNVGQTLAVGGNGLLEGSLELRWNVWGDLTLAIFNDWGLVSATPLGPTTDLKNSLYAAVGLGVRYKTPLGPIRFDLGFRLPFVGGPQKVDTEGVNYFQTKQGCFFSPVYNGNQALPYAGSPDNLCNFHLSIGEAF